MSITSLVIILFPVVLVGVLCRRLSCFTGETLRGVTRLFVNVTPPCQTLSSMQRPFSMDVLRNFVLTLARAIAYSTLLSLVTVPLMSLPL